MLATHYGDFALVDELHSSSAFSCAILHIARGVHAIMVIVAKARTFREPKNLNFRSRNIIVLGLKVQFVAKSNVFVPKST